MTAEEWEACQDPRPMLEATATQASARRLRLFAAACCRSLWRVLRDGRSRRAVVALEGHAEGATPADELARARREAAEAFRAVLGLDGLADFVPLPSLARAMTARFWAAQAVAAALDWERHVCWAVPSHAAKAHEAGLTWWARLARGADVRTFRRQQAAILRCVLGCPFRNSVAFPPAVLARNDGTAVKLATVIYNDRDPSTGLLDATGLAILADALEEAGVDDAAALAHLRGPGPHCRGCHVVDAVLGRG